MRRNYKVGGRAASRSGNAGVQCRASEWVQLGLGVVRVRSIADDSFEGEGGSVAARGVTGSER